jgi:hypothetical protein
MHTILDTLSRMTIGTWWSLAILMPQACGNYPAVLASFLGRSWDAFQTTSRPNFPTITVTMSPSRHVICLLAVTVGVNAFRQQPIGTTSDSKDTFDPSFDHWVEDLLKECHTPGVSIAVVEDGRITSKVSPHQFLVR